MLHLLPERWSYPLASLCISISRGASSLLSSDKSIICGNTGNKEQLLTYYIKYVD